MRSLDLRPLATLSNPDRRLFTAGIESFVRCNGPIITVVSVLYLLTLVNIVEVPVRLDRRSSERIYCPVEIPVGGQSQRRPVSD
jgi:uncharacterized membrane protein